MHIAYMFCYLYIYILKIIQICSAGKGPKKKPPLDKTLLGVSMCKLSKIPKIDVQPRKDFKRALEMGSAAFPRSLVQEH